MPRKVKRLKLLASGGPWTPKWDDNHKATKADRVIVHLKPSTLGDMRDLQAGLIDKSPAEILQEIEDCARKFVDHVDNYDDANDAPIKTAEDFATRGEDGFLNELFMLYAEGGQLNEVQEKNSAS